MCHIKWHNLCHNSSRNSLTWRVVSGKEVTPHGPIITFLPLTICHMSKLLHRLYHFMWHFYVALAQLLFIYFFFYEKFINISFIWKRDTTEKVDNNREKNNKQLHTPVLNEPESPTINLCLHIKILGFLFLNSSNPI